MSRKVFDEIKQIIRDRTGGPQGHVANLHGVVEEATILGEEPASQGWFVLSAAVRAMPTLRDFIDAYSFERLPYLEVDARDGRTIYPATGSIPLGQATLFFTSVNLSGSVTLPVEVTAPGHQIAVYADGAVVNTGAGEAVATLQLTQGLHFIAVLCFGSPNAIRVDVAPAFALVRQEPTPAPPQLEGNPTVDYLRASIGTYVTTVRWHNDAFASAWGVYRCEAVDTAPIVAGTDEGGGFFTARLEGTVPVEPKELFFTKQFFGGEVVEVTHVEDPVLGPVTDVRIRLDIGAPVTAADWTNEVTNGRYFRPTELYTSVARATYSGEPVLSHEDATVRQGAVYLYRVTAFGFITGTAESDYSLPGYAYVNDLTPPGDITFDSEADVRVVDGELFLDYTAPVDADYLGVKVFLEDPLDGSRHILLARELGAAGERDQLSTRLPMPGRYWFRTFDTSGNVQPVGSGQFIDWDGTVDDVNALEGVLIGSPQANGTADIELRVFGAENLFPATAEFFLGQLDTPLDLGSGVTVAQLAAAGAVNKTLFAGLGGIPLPLSGAVHLWAKLVDSGGRVTFAYTSVDRGAVPGGAVVAEDYLPFPNLTCIYDEDVDEIEITIPNPDGSLLGTVTYTRAAGLQPVGGGAVIYTVGNLVVRKPDTTLTQELDFAVDSTRGDYVVRYKGGATTLVMWQGRLHGAPSNPPSIEVIVALDETLRNAADITATVTSPVGEPVTIEFKDEDDPTLPLWKMVSGHEVVGRHYVPSGTVVGPEAWFRSDIDETEGGDGPEPDVWAQKFNNVALKVGQVKRVAVRAIGQHSGVPSGWVMVPMPFTEIPVVQSVDLAFDESTDQLILTATGGQFCRSARFEISTAENFALAEVMENAALSDGGVGSVAKTVADGDRDKMWYGRVTGFNGGIVATIPPSVSGLGGVPLRDSEYVPLTGVDESTGAAVFQVDTNGHLVLAVTRVQSAESFGYTVAEASYNFDRQAQTLVNFDVGSDLKVVDLGQAPTGGTRYAVVWFYPQVDGGGTPGRPATDKYTVVESLEPKFEHIIQMRDQAQPGLKVDFEIRIIDPQNKGGTFKAWVNKLGVQSGNPNNAPDQTLAVPSTPFIASNLNFSALNDVTGSGSEDKYVYFEFVNSTGQSTGKKEVKVTSRLLDVGDDGKLKPGVLQLENFATQIRPVRVIANYPLPQTGNTVGDMMYVASDSRLFRWTGFGWTAAVQTVDLSGQINGTQITNDAISTPHIQANSINATKIAAGAITAGHMTANSITAGSIAAGAVNATHIAANAIQAQHIQAGTITANKLNVLQLSDVATNVGIIVAGKLQSIDGQRYLDLNATGSNRFISHPNFSLFANGSAFFSGNLSLLATSGNTISFWNTSGTQYASILAEMFLGSIPALSIGITGSALRMYADVGFGPTALFSNMNVQIDTGRNINFAGVCEVHSGNSRLNIRYGVIDRYFFQNDGRAFADLGWSTFSPTPPKAAAQMTPADWVVWAAEDARKPVKPYEGLPAVDHPEVQRLAQDRGKTAAEVVAEEEATYAKDVSKIAIGVANWAYLVQQALQESGTFAQFKQRLTAALPSP
jgi:hypothetical protein